MFTDFLKKKIAKTHHETIRLDVTVPCDIKIFDLSADIDADKIVNDIYDFQKQYPNSMHIYNSKNTFVKAWHSDFLTHKMTTILDKFMEVQNEKVNQFMPNSEVLVRDIWMNIYSKDDSAARHDHHIQSLSSVYFPYVDKNPTPIIFDNNNINNPENVSIVPKKNMLIIFPSFMFHHVPKITEERRISIASNFHVKFNSKINPFDFQSKNITEDAESK